MRFIRAIRDPTPTLGTRPSSITHITLPSLHSSTCSPEPTCLTPSRHPHTLPSQQTAAEAISPCLAGMVQDATARYGKRLDTCQKGYSDYHRINNKEHTQASLEQTRTPDISSQLSYLLGYRHGLLLEADLMRLQQVGRQTERMYHRDTTS